MGRPGPILPHDSAQLTRSKPVPLPDVGEQVYGYTVWEKEIKMMERIWQGLREGDLFRQIFFYLFRALSVLVALVGLFFMVGLIVQLMQQLTLWRLIGGAFSLLLYLLGLFFLAGNFWKRAGLLRTLPTDDLPITDIGAVIFRLTGETLAILLGVVGFGGAILIWFTGARTAWGLLPFLVTPMSRSFVAGDPVSVLLTGLATLAIYAFLAAAALLWHYLLAEVIIIFKGIYRNTQPRGEAQ
jgi:hypothetical protein